MLIPTEHFTVHYKLMVFEGISIVVEILKEGKTIENIINELLVLTITHK